MGANIHFKVAVPTTTKKILHWLIIEFVNILQLNYQKYKTNGTVRYENYERMLLFTMKAFFTWNKYQIHFFVSNISLEENIGGIWVPQFKLDQIREY